MGVGKVRDEFSFDSKDTASSSAISGCSLGRGHLYLLNILGRANHLLWVDGVTAHQNFKMQVFACGNACVTNISYQTVGGDFVADLGQ